MRRAAVAFVAAAVLGSACSVDRQTQITLAISSEAEIPDELDAFTIHVTVTRTGELRFSQDYFPTSGRQFPTTLAVIPLDEDSLKSPLRVEIEGRKGAAVLLRRVAIMSYVEGRNLLLSMPLRMACFQFRGCGPTETCAGGQCVDATALELPLVDFSESYVSPSASGCFDEDRCLASPSLVEVADDCTFPLAPSTTNVAIRWAAAPKRILALDANDAQEGWTRIAPDRGRLCQGICDSHFQRRGADGALLVSDWAKDVYVTTSCSEKTRLVPYCYSAVTGHAGIGAIHAE